MNFFTRIAHSVLLLFFLGAATLLSSDNEPFTLKGIKLEKISKIQEISLLDPSTKKKILVEVYFTKEKETTVNCEDCQGRSSDDKDLLQAYQVEAKLFDYLSKRHKSVKLLASSERFCYLIMVQKETRELLSSTLFSLVNYPSGAKVLEDVGPWISKRFIGKEMVQLIGKYLEKIARNEKCGLIFFSTSNRSLTRYLDPLGYKAYRSDYDIESPEPCYAHVKKVKI